MYRQFVGSVCSKKQYPALTAGAQEALLMDTKFSECVVALKDLRRTVHSDTDPSIRMALDKVIIKLESYKEKANVDDAEVRMTVAEGLMIISTFLNCCLSLADLIGSF